MGLDGVELIMAVEEEFSVEISDANAEKIRTPQDLIDIICAKMAAADKPGRVCQSQHSFYRLRRALCTQTGQPRKTVTPATPLTDLLPVDMRDPSWRKLREAVQAEEWPSPVRSPGAVRATANLVCLSSILLSFVIVPGGWTRGKGDPEPLLVGMCDGSFMMARIVALVGAAIFLAIVAMLVTRPLRRYLPTKVKRVGDLAKFIRKRDPERILSREQVAEKVRELVLEQLGISADKYREDADFVKDFGMN